MGLCHFVVINLKYFEGVISRHTEVMSSVTQINRAVRAVSPELMRAATPALRNDFSDTFIRSVKAAVLPAGVTMFLAVAGKAAAEVAKNWGRPIFIEEPYRKFESVLLRNTGVLTFVGALAGRTLLGLSTRFIHLQPARKLVAEALFLAPFALAATAIAEIRAKREVPPETRADEMLFEKLVKDHAPRRRGDSLQNAAPEIHTLRAHNAGSHDLARADRLERRRASRHVNTLQPQEAVALRFAYDTQAVSSPIKAPSLFSGEPGTVVDLQFGENQPAPVSFVGNISVFSPAFGEQTSNPFMTR